eukprot:TRINITY_DN193_c0_g4_i6.p2 TRINITY_DN193_c0_g4~~TRINITY_DN193_c0_g4_i6.p2  ORF type:complete len:107 (-),score=14.20 TRINITY_DN193_c0_g4_i6:568-888(-)
MSDQEILNTTKDMAGTIPKRQKRNPEVRYQGQFSSFENQVEDRARRMVTIPRLNTTREVIRCTFFTNKGLQSNLLSAKTFSFEKYNKTPKIWKTVPKVIVVTPKTE